MENMDHVNIDNLGDLIKFHRQKKDLSIIELSKKTKIRVQQLINLEENKFNELPNRVYLVGFLKALSNELDISLDLALKFLNEINNKEEVLELLPSEKEIKPLPSKFIKKSSDKKIIAAAIILCSFTIVASIELSKKKNQVSKDMKERVPTNVSTNVKEQLLQSDVVSLKDAAVAKESVLPKDLLLATPPQVETKIAPVMQQLTITAKKGTAFIAYRVDQNRLVKYYLKKGEVLELKGELIRLDAGNPDALEFSKNGEPLTIEKNTQNPLIHLVFPEERPEQRQVQQDQSSKSEIL